MKKNKLIYMLGIFVFIMGLSACHTEHSDVKWTCPMHPQIIRNDPGACPICGMNLVPLKAAEKPVEQGDTSITIDPYAVQNLGMKMSTVIKKEISDQLLVSGRVVHDHNLWVAQNEYLEVLKLGDKNLVLASESKLRLMGLSESWISDLRKNKKSDLSFHLPGLHQPVFIEAFVSQNEIDKVKTGLKVKLQNGIGKSIGQGIVRSVSTVIEPDSLTVRVLIQSEKPVPLPLNSFVQVSILVPLGENLVIPESAAILTGSHQYVYVDHGQGKFERRLVKLGSKGSDEYTVIDGLIENEVVVASGHFLLDAETQRVLGTVPTQENQHGDHP